MTDVEQREFNQAFSALEFVFGKGFSISYHQSLYDSEDVYVTYTVAIHDPTLQQECVVTSGTHLKSTIQETITKFYAERRTDEQIEE